MAKNENIISLLSIFKDSQHNISIFQDEEIAVLEKKIIVKNKKPYVECIIRGKEIQLKPEEVVRQLYASKLMKKYGYPRQRIKYITRHCQAWR